MIWLVCAYRARIKTRVKSPEPIKKKKPDYDVSLQCQHWRGRGRDGQIAGAGWLVSQPCLLGEHQVQ